MRLFERNPLDWDTLSPMLKVLLVLNLAVFLLQWMTGYLLIEIFGLIPKRALGDLWLWQFVTYMFLHGGILHLFFNLLMLWMFGTVLEGQWGSREFLRYYLVCGVGAGLASVGMGWGSSVPTIGASGALFGLLTAFAMVFPDAVVYVWFLFPMTARTMAIVFGILELFMTLGASGSGVSTVAHLGGMVTGWLYLRYEWKFRTAVTRLARGMAGLVPPSTGGSRRVRRPRAEERGPEGGLEEEVNRILDKVLAHGEASLTSEEKEIMRRYSRKGP